jgi:hypothetical protein
MDGKVIKLYLSTANFNYRILDFTILEEKIDLIYKFLKILKT